MTPFGLSAMSGCVLPEDILVCILTRLPVKSILRFKSVSKPWRYLLSAHEFIRMHRAQFSLDPKNQSFALTCHRSMSLLEIESDEERLTIDYPSPETYVMNIVGCCNGLICMGHPRLESVFLWNPAMKLFKFVKLLKHVDITNPEMGSLGFGYDAENDDFKVVRVLCLGNQMDGGDSIDVIGAEVYSVNSGSWVTVEPGFRFGVLWKINSAVVNGNPYWSAKVDENESAERHLNLGQILVCFDVKRMIFQTVPLSSLNLNNITKGETVPLVDWKGSLAALVHERAAKSLHVWVFDDGEQIWKKSHTFGPIEINGGWNLTCTKNGRVMGERPGRELFVFDTKSGYIKEVYGAQSILLEIYPYTESLTYIKGMKQGEEEDEPWLGH